MPQQIDYAAFELGIARPRLRDDLRFSVRDSKHGASYIIEDETSSKFYRIGLAEYTFLSLLDGETTVQSAVAATAAKLGHQAFTETEAAALCKWLVDTGLAQKHRFDRERWQKVQHQKSFVRRMQWVNPIMMKLPVGNPDRLIGGLLKYTAWMITPLAGLVWLGVCVAALILLLSNADHLSSQSPIFAKDNWWMLGLVWIALRVIHEAAHALTCKRFGGRVREWGILFLLFIPLPYVDVTTAWRFPERRKRILTSAAGMMAELLLAALAVFVWHYSDPGTLKHHALNVMLAAGVTTLLFNANPLMRFDGYHILADVLDAPNLWTHGRAFVRSLGRWIFYGLGSGNPPWRPTQTWLVRIYGIAAAVWKVLIFVSLTLAALSFLDGFGLIFALTAALLWIGVPVFQITRFLWSGTETEQPNRRRCALVVTGCVCTLILLGLVIPAPSAINAPVVIQHDPLTIVYNKPAGFVQEFPVRPGQHVSKGDVICRLENVDLLAQQRSMRAQLAASRQRVRTYQADNEPAAAQVEWETTMDLKARLDELGKLINSLTITAPHDGVILGSDFDQQIGTYLRPGSEVITIGGVGTRKAIAMVTQDAAPSLQDMEGHAAQIRVWGSSENPVAGRIERVHPRAQTSLPHFSFAAPAGGDLTVLAATESDRADGVDWILARPHVQLEISLDQRTGLKTGQTGQVSIRAREGLIGPYLVAQLSRMISQQIKKSHGL